MPRSRVWDDIYKQNQKLPDGHPDKLPDPRTFHLVPMSQARPASQVAPDSSAEDAAQAPDAEGAGR